MTPEPSSAAAAAAAAAAAPSHPRLDALVRRAQERAKGACPRIGLVYPCDASALDAAGRIARAGLAQPIMIGPRDAMARAADAAAMDLADFEIVDSTGTATQAAQRATAMARAGSIAALMKGSLHTDELMSPIVDRHTGLRTDTRISHAFVFDLPRYHKLLALADCVVNIQPSLSTKRDIVSNALGLLRRVLGIAQPRVGIVAAVETVNPAIPATVDAQALVELARQGAWPGALVEGPLGLDNAISAEAARTKKIDSCVAGDPDLLLMPDLNAGNMLYKSFVYLGGAECAGLVLGACVPIVLTSRADSLSSRIASVALAVLVAAQTTGN